MVMAKLHLICGNCGNSEHWEWNYTPEELCNGETINAKDVDISCLDCATIHLLSDNAKSKPDNK